MDYTSNRTKTASVGGSSLVEAFNQFLKDTAAQVFGPRVAPEKYVAKVSPPGATRTLYGTFFVEVTSPVALDFEVTLQISGFHELGVLVHGKSEKKEKAFPIDMTTPPRIAQWVTDIIVEAAASAQPGAIPREPEVAPAAEAEGIKKGDIFVSNWGYDQTNVDFYEVTDVKGKIVVIREIHKQVTPGSHGSDKVTPLPGRFDGEPMRKRPSYRNGKPSLKMTDYAWAYPWDGKPEEQTSSGYGH